MTGQKCVVLFFLFGWTVPLKFGSMTVFCRLEQSLAPSLPETLMKLRGTYRIARQQRPSSINLETPSASLHKSCLKQWTGAEPAGESETHQAVIRSACLSETDLTFWTAALLQSVQRISPFTIQDPDSTCTLMITGTRQPPGSWEGLGRWGWHNDTISFTCSSEIVPLSCSRGSEESLCTMLPLL